MKNTKVWLLTALVSTLLAMSAHAYLSVQSYGLKSGSVEGKSVCNISSQFNCDAVALSDYSEFLGVPMAMWGLVTNALLIVFVLGGGLNLSIDRDRVLKAAFVVASIIVAASLVMGAVSMLTLGTYCLFCIAAYALSAVQLFAVWKMQEEPFLKDLGEDIAGVFSQQRWIAVMFLLVPAFGFLGHSMAADAYGLKNAKWAITESLEFWQKAPVQTFDPALGLSLQNGTGTPKMVIVEFADYLCPHCKHAATPLHSFTESRTDVQLIFKVFPLDGTCNAAMQQKGDGLRCELAAATVCAEKLSKKGWAAHDWIFAHQNKMNSVYFRENFETFAKAVGGEVPALRECIESSETKDQVAKMADEGGKAQIPGTPAIFVNGKKLDRGQMIPVLDAVYKSL